MDVGNARGAVDTGSMAPPPAAHRRASAPPV
jgi:hypothetical protein